MNVHVGMYKKPHAHHRARWVYISGVDFGCFSTVWGIAKPLKSVRNKRTSRFLCMYVNERQKEKNNKK